MKGLSVRHLALGVCFCALIIACAGTRGEPETPAYHHRFEHAEQWAKEFDDPCRDSWQEPDRVLAAMQVTPGMTIAVIGAGTGYFEPHLSRAVGPGGKVIALDVEPDMVSHLRDRAARPGSRYAS